VWLHQLWKSYIKEIKEETPPRKSIKQARQAQKKSSSGGGSSRKAAHPAVSQMIPEAIRWDLGGTYLPTAHDGHLHIFKVFL